MTNLVGVSSIGSYTTATGANGQSGARFIHLPFVASASGSATSLFFYARANNTPNVKLCIYTNGGSLLANTGAIAIAEGWNSASISTVSIVSGTTYKLGWYADAGFTDYWTIASAGDAYHDDTGSYTTPASSITSTLNTGIDQFAMYADGTVDSGSVTKTPTNAVMTAAGLQPSHNAFTFVRIRDVLINESGQPVGSQTNLRLLVWYSGVCVGAPDVSLIAQTTDTNGTASWSLPTGSLVKDQPIFYVVQDSLSFSNYSCGRMIPSYE